MIFLMKVVCTKDTAVTTKASKTMPKTSSIRVRDFCESFILAILLIFKAGLPTRHKRQFLLRSPRLSHKKKLV